MMRPLPARGTSVFQPLTNLKQPPAEKNQPLAELRAAWDPSPRHPEPTALPRSPT